jgi:hypothetical protein
VKTSVATLPGAPLGARQRWLVVGKIALVLAGLGLLVRWALAGLAPTDGSGALHLAPVGLVAAVLLNQAALFAAALRLRATLAAFGVRLSAAQAMAIHLRSLFYFFFVPLSVGLEVSRYLDIRRIDADVPAKTLVLVLLLDRVLGLVAAVAALAAFASLVLPASVWARVDAGWLALGAAAVLAGAGLVLLRRPWQERAADLLRVLKAGSVRLLVPVLLSLLALALVCASVYVVAATSGWAAGFAEIAFALSASLLGMALPLSLLGVTVGEATGVGVMALLGLAPALAVMLVSLAYVGRLLGAVQGAALELHGGVRVLRRQAAPGSGETL